MAKLGDLVAVIGANTTGFNKALGEVNRNAQRMSGNIGKLGKQMTASLTLPLALFGAKAFKVFAGFEQEMAKVKAVSGATAGEFKKLEANAKQLGATTRYSASEVATLQAEFAKLGFTADDITKVTGATLSLAQAADTDLATAAKVAGTTLRAFGLEADQTARVADVMALSFSSSGLDVESFAESMKFVAPVARKAGVSIEQTTAMLGKLADNGVKGSQAGTALRRIMADLGSTGGDVGGSIKKLAAKGLNLKNSMDEVGRSAQTALLVLAENMDGVDGMTTSLNDSGGAAQKMADIMDATATGSMARLKSAAEAMMISVGEALAPTILKFANILSKLASRFSQLSPSTQKIIVLIGSLVAAAGPMLFVFSKIITLAPLIGAAITAMTGPFGLIALAVVGAAAAIITNWGAISEYFSNGEGSGFLTGLQESFDSIFGSIKEIFSASVDFLQAYWAVFGENLLRDIMTPLELVIDVFTYVFKQVSNVISFWKKVFQGDISGAFGELKNIAATTVNFLIDVLMSVAKVALNVADKISKAFGGDGFYEDAVAGLEEFANGFKLPEKQAKKTEEAIKSMKESASSIGGGGSLSSVAGSSGGGSGSGGGASSGVFDPVGSLWDINEGNTAATQMQRFDDQFDDLMDMEAMDAESFIDPQLEEDLVKHADSMELLREKADAVGGAVAGAFQTMGTKLVNSLGLADEGFQGFVKGLSSTVLELISMMLAQSISTAIAGATTSAAATGPGAVFAQPAFISTAVGGILSAFAAIPKFADGGIVSGPTIGMMGEYAGAKTNPEVIAPLDKLRGMIRDEASGGGRGGNMVTRIKGADLFIMLEKAGKDIKRNR